MAPIATSLCLFALLGGCAATQERETLAIKMMANPIRKVVVMLQAMQKKVQAEGEKEEELYEKFMCYCKNGAGALSKSIADAEAKAPDLSRRGQGSDGGCQVGSHEGSQRLLNVAL